MTTCSAPFERNVRQHWVANVSGPTLIAQRSHRSGLPIVATKVLEANLPKVNSSTAQ
jgi:hypothetical protein